MMKVCILFLSMMFLLAPAGKAQPKIWDETEQEKQERMAWWTHDRLSIGDCTPCLPDMSG